MARVISVHEYELRRDVEPADFEAAIRAARERGLFDLPGLVDVRFARALRATRRQAYAAIWTYESREAWEALWGPPNQPAPRDAHPGVWQEWENGILAQLLDRRPDTINFAAYEEI